MSRVTDHRGRPVRLYGVPQDHEHPWAVHAVPVDEHRRFTARLRRRMRPLVLLIFGAGGAGILGVIVLIQWAVRHAGGSKATFEAIMVVVVLGLSALLGLCLKVIVHRRYGGELIATFLAQRRCPSCAYHLIDMPLEGDGCVVCPECAAAWKLPPKPAGNQ